MRLLLDTHAYLWWLADDPRLSDAARSVLSDPEALVYVSAASIWEAATKSALGRMDAGESDLVAEITENGFLELPIRALHAQEAGALPPHHHDPFDRVLIAQALSIGLRCVTRDPMFERYDVSTLW